MKKYESAFSSAATRIGSAAKKTSEDYAEKVIPDEPTFTGALVTRIRDSLAGYSKGGITWNAKILSSHGPNTEESQFGADFLGSLALDLPDYKVRKGFLAQAKRQEPDSPLTGKEWSRLQVQCERMLGFSTSSYAFVYSLNGVFVVPAVSIVACIQPEDMHTLHPKTLGSFYKQHFMCFVGDRVIDSSAPRVLDNLRARTTLAISASAGQKNDLFSNDEA